MFHETALPMRASVTERVRKHREILRAAGLKPVQLWLPDTRNDAFRRKCEQECQLLAAKPIDPLETETLDWIGEVADTDGWV